MIRMLTAGAVAIVLTVAGVDAKAVDIANEDEQPYQLQVNIDGDEKVIFVPAGETVTGICEECSLSLDGEDTVDAKGDQVAMIRNGKLTVQ
jgi:hypothetical protein